MSKESSEICALCGLPKELCICQNLVSEEQEIIIFNDRRKWGKIVTLATFKGNDNLDLESILKKAKRKLGSGGTLRGKSTIEIRGDQKFNLKKLLINLGFDKESITIRA